jgi:transcription antitermination factor NusG
MGKAIDADTELRWLAFRTSSQQSLMELTVRVLRNSGLIADIAMEKRLRKKTKWDKERKPRPYVTAPGYVFIATERGTPFPWHKLQSIHMIRGVIGTRGKPAELSDSAVRSFLRWEGERLPAYMRFMKTGQEFKPGDKVYIADGSLDAFTDGCPIKVENIEDGSAVFILKLLGQDVEHRIDVRDCVKAA